MIGAVAAASLAMMGCGMDMGDGKASGTKWNTTMTVGEIPEEGKEAEAKDARFWSHLGTAEKVEAITETITIFGENTEKAKNKGVFSAKGRYAVVGFGFDWNVYKTTNKEGKEVDAYDFCLVGYRPSTNEAYLERYKGVTKETLDDPKITALGLYNSYMSGAWTTGWNEGGYNDWVAVKGATVDKETGDITFTLKIEQTNGVYTVTLGDTVLGTFSKDSIPGYTNVKESADAAKLTEDDPEYKTRNGNLAGGVMVYGFAPAGTKAVANFKADKESLVGTLYVEGDDEAATLELAD